MLRDFILSCNKPKVVCTSKKLKEVPPKKTEIAAFFTFLFLCLPPSVPMADNSAP